MKSFKKIISVLLVVLMLLGTGPMTKLGVEVEAAYENTHINTGNQRNDIIEVAKTQLGYREGSNNDTKYGTWYGLPNQPWCAMFVSWCARQAGIPKSVIPNLSYVPNYFTNSAFTIKKSGYTPKSGDIFLTKSQSHVGLVWYVEGSYFYTLEGNSSDCVCSNKYLISNYYFAVPNYEEGPECTGYNIAWNYNTEGGKFYDSNTVDLTITPKIDGRDATDNEIKSIFLYVKYPDGTVKSGNMGKNKTYSFYMRNGAAGTYTFWAAVDTVYGSSKGAADDRSLSLTLTRVSLANSTYDDAVVYRRIKFEDLNTYLTATADENAVSNKRETNNSGNQSQVWKMIKNSDSTYIIESLKNGKVLDITKGNFARGTNVITYASQNSENQKWYLSQNSNGEWFIRAAMSNSAVLDVEDGNKADGTNVGLWTYNGSAAQKVDFEYPYQIVYNANGGTGAPSTQSKDYNETISLRTTKPTRSGYTFLGWSTSSTATSASYSAGSSYSSNADLTLYAVWKANPYNLSYNANGGSGTPSTQTGSTTYTISKTIPTRPGYTFIGWSKSSSATSASYAPGESISITSNTTLYAVWKKGFYGDVNEDGTINDQDVMLLNNMRLFGTEKTSLRVFKGDLDGDGQLDFDDVELLQKFVTKIISVFPVENLFGTFNIYEMPTKTTYKQGEKITADGMSVLVYYTNGHYHIIDTGFVISPLVASDLGWQDATVSIGDWSDEFDIYVEDASSRTLTYNANGGSGAPSNQTGSAAYTISSTVPARQGYTFLGWSKSSSATSASYEPGDSISLTSNTTLYAVWKAATAIYTETTYNTTIDFAGQEYFYTFTPSSTGNYIFESTGSLDTKVYVYNSSWTEVGTDDDDGADSNFKLTVNLTSGNKYYVKVRAYNSKVGTTSFTVKKDVPATYTLSYSANGGSGAPSNQTGDTSYTISSTVPTRRGYTFLGWSKSSSATSASYEPGDSISLTSNTTLYAVWKAAETLLDGEDYEISIDFEDQEYYYVFTPSKTCKHMFESFSYIDTTIYVYNSSWTQIGYNDDSGVEENFLLHIDLSASHKYYVKVCASGSDTGYVTFGVIENEEIHSHSYSSSVTKQPGCETTGTRKYLCGCGDSYTETIPAKGHTPSSEYVVVKEAHCTETGVKTNSCTVCKKCLAEEKIEATGHKYNNGNICSSCGYARSKACSCTCHEGGIIGLFFNIILFFQNLFGQNKVCACGIAH